MERISVNPWDWSLKFGFNQGEVIADAKRELICAGQTSVDAEGTPQHDGDMRAQLALALDNLEAVLKEAGMGLSNVVKLTVFTTDMEALMPNFDLMGMRFGPAGVAAPMSLLEVRRLALQPLMVEIEATAYA